MSSSRNTKTVSKTDYPVEKQRRFNEYKTSMRLRDFLYTSCKR